jgi:hypothetical protein
VIGELAEFYRIGLQCELTIIAPPTIVLAHKLLGGVEVDSTGVIDVKKLAAVAIAEKFRGTRGMISRQLT